MIRSYVIFVVLITMGVMANLVEIIPEVYASHNANLIVSAENSNFNNYFAGPMVIEVVISDSSIASLSDAVGEPDVTVNGNNLRMLQASDGKWYGYFADRNMAQIADSTTSVAGVGLDFGTFCANDDGDEVLGFSVTDTVGFAVPRNVTGGTQGQTSITSEQCSGGIDTNLQNNVVRESKTINTASPSIGQIGFTSYNLAWPFIQLYNFVPTGNVVIQYNKGGGVQTTTLTFDTVDQFASAQIDRTQYPRGSEVHLTVTDAQLNIDPTDEDSWTWDTSNDGTLHTLYQVFDENGNQAADGISANAFDINPHLTDLMFEDNGILTLNVNLHGAATNVLTLVDNADQRYVDGTGNTAKNTQLASDVRTQGETLGTDTQPVTLTEQGINNGIFGSYDENDKSNIVITDNAIRGTSAIIDYNETPKTILVGFNFGTIDIQPVDNEWNSGEEIPVMLVDVDANKNSKVDEDLDLNNPNVSLIPTLVTGAPFTLQSISTAQAITNVNTFFTIDIQPFSQRAILTSLGTAPSGTFALDLTLSYTYGDLYNSINDPENSFHGFNFFNYDVRSIADSMIGGSTTSVDITLNDPMGGKSVILADNASLQGFINLDNTTGDPLFSLTGTQNVVIHFAFNVNGTPQITSGTKIPIVADFFSYGFFNDGIQKQDRVANQIIRLELEETGDNTSTFAGSLEYLMLNQLNILNPFTYDNLSTIDSDPKFIVIENLIDEDSPRVNYFDLGSDGTTTQISDPQQVTTHSGIVSFDKGNYDAGQLVTITLNDQDLNVDSDLIDIYTVVNLSGDAAFDTIGISNLPVFSFGPLGRMLELTFDESKWSSGLAINGGTCNAAGFPDDGLGQTGFTLVETGISTGVFRGEFNVPQNFCNSVTGSITDTNGKEMKVTYVDFRNSLGAIIPVSDSATIGSSLNLMQWSFEEIAGKALDLPNNDGIIIMPENLDVYFSTVNQIQEKVADAIPPDRYDIQTHAYYDDKDLTLTKTIAIKITNHDEFVSVFENDRTSLASPLQIGDAIVDENFITKKIDSSLQSCIQGIRSLEYCSKTPEELKRLILEKIGTHTINESIILNRIVTNSKINTMDIKPTSITITPTIHNEFDNNINHMVSDFSYRIFHVGKIVGGNNLLPPAIAQTDDPQNGGSGVYTHTFLNGFTIGYGFKKDWSYEFKVHDSIPIYVETSIENGLGIGFRIPIEAALKIDPILLRPISVNDAKFGIEYTITTKDLNAEQYLELGLTRGQEFDGKEFKIYLGPRVSILIKLFDETLVDKDIAAIEEIPEEKDFTPPLDILVPPVEITSYTVDCTFTRTCLDTPIGTIGLFSGAKANMSGEKVTIESNPIKATIAHQDLTFNKNGESKRHNYDVPTDIIDTQSSQDPVSFGTVLQDVKYYSSLYFIPRIKLEAELTSWILPFSISSDWVNFPEIQFNNVVFEKHENTKNIFKIDNGKMYSVSTEPVEKPIPCGLGTVLVEGQCVPEEIPEEEGGGCLIATATFGSEFAPQVQFLREIRDNTVLSTASGASFMTAFNTLYYSFSPTVSDWERQNPAFKQVVKLFITPLLTSLTIMTLADSGSEVHVLGLGIATIAFNIGVYMVTPVIMIWQFKKRF